MALIYFYLIFNYLQVGFYKPIKVEWERVMPGSSTPLRSEKGITKLITRICHDYHKIITLRFRDWNPVG